MWLDRPISGGKSDAASRHGVGLWPQGTVHPAPRRYKGSLFAYKMSCFLEYSATNPRLTFPME